MIIRSGNDHVEINYEKSDIGYYELIISDVQKHHGGVYSCKATNEHGEAHCEGTVTINGNLIVCAFIQVHVQLIIFFLFVFF